MSPRAADPAWLAALQARADQSPRRPRVPLWFGASRIGSVEPDLFAAARIPAALAQSCARGGEQGWQVCGELTSSLHAIALVLRDAGIAQAWRDEQLAVRDEGGRVLGTVERAVVRPLGITTHAVHLAGFSSDGRHWVQQRSLSKPNDPGMWDTLMGGMVPACDSLEEALARETWEEAGLRMSQLQQLAYGGRVRMRCPSDGRAGYVVEHIDWYRCVLPPGVEPQNQDGEVAQFRQMRRDELLQCLEGDGFTTEAALVLTRCGL